MAEHVRVHVPAQAALQRPVAKALLDGARAKATPRLAKKHGRRVAFCHLRAELKPPLECFSRRSPNGDQALFRALAHHAGFTAIEMQRQNIESRELGYSQARRIRQ